MPKFKKVHSCEWQIIEGLPCVIFVGRDGSRREVRVAVPASIIVTTVASDARRRLAALAKQGEHDSTPNTWNQVGFLRAEGVEVGITDEYNIGVVLDPGEETEFAISIVPRLARERAIAKFW